MNENDDLLSFLVEGLIAPQRDLVTRAFYKFAEGDPNSAPVNEAILLTACARRLAHAPKELREASTVLKKLLEEARDVERRVIERVEKSNASVIAAFKDEVTRASSNLRTTAQYSERIVKEGQQISETMQKLLAQGESLTTTLQLTKLELKAHNESTQKIVEATTNTGTSIQAIKEIMANLNAMSVANWLTLGIIIGFALTGIAIETELPWWGRMLVFGVPIGLLQLIAGGSWASVKKEAATMRNP
jgi:hypothetical protein